MIWKATVLNNLRWRELYTGIAIFLGTQSSWVMGSRENNSKTYEYLPNNWTFV